MKDSLGARGSVRFGVIGCGTVAYWTHLRELKKLNRARLVAAADPDPSARARASRLANVPVHANANELLARSDIDAVIISAPNCFHAELALAAAKAGKHLYLEKPIAVAAGDARRVVDAAEEAGIVSAMGFNRRCHPVFEQGRALISKGKIGRVRAVQTVFSEPSLPASMPDWKRGRETGGGVLLDLASHHLDLLRWFLGDEVERIEARVTSDVTEQDSAWLWLSMRSGAEASGFFSFRAGRADTLEFIGEHGTLRLDRHRCVLSLRRGRRFGYGVRRSFVLPSAGAVAWRLARLTRPSWESSYRRALAAFVQMCRGGPRRLASLSDGLRNLEIILAAEESARTGAVVPVAGGI
ncbi:MAG TPA: Gfo/Idh/MocA family oxidoreductase [Chthoniobacterales bacterium]|nr:Gfo/Idh/MocA family oxidoreductase [Chthoniobacterales bacterium]